MKTKKNKENPRKILGYLMAFAMVLFSLNVNGQVFSEDFSSGAMPAGWSVTCDGGGSGFVFSGNPGYYASTTQGNTAASGTFAWIDFSSSDVGCWMQMPDVDVSSLSSALLSFDFFSDIGTYSTSPNSLFVEANDGSAWNVIATLNQFTTGWAPQYIDCSGADVGGILTLRFRAESSGLSSDYYNDLLIDNVTVGENNLGVLGCTDELACNYDPAATTDDGSCTYPASASLDCSGNCINGGSYLDVKVQEISTSGYMYGLVQYGGSWSLTDYNSGTAIAGAGVTDLFSDCLPDGCYEISGISGSGANYAFAYSIDGGVNYTTPGSAGATGTDWIAVGSGVCPVAGCTDELACNYDPAATVDNGSCDLTSCLGCTDPGAVNYDASATIDDGSCSYACTAAPYSEGFESGTGTWATANTGSGSYPGWYRDSGGTPSSSTGPTSGAGGSTWYMFIETSGTGGPYTLTSECLDISALANPALRFSYHMYGASMGTLDVSVNGTSVWTMSGNQGNAWIDAQVDLSAYIGSNVTIVFTGSRGTSFTGDMALDNIEVDEGASSGCTDPNACNYDPAASIDDGSCYTLTVSTSATDVTCNGSTDGSATASANVAATYMWDNGSSTASISALAPGTYSVTVEDANGCLSTASAVVGEPTVVSASLLVGNESAAGANDGQIDLSPSGGVPCITSSSLASTVGSSNGSAGAMFNMINTSGGDLTITGISQGAYSSFYGGVATFDIYYYPGDYVPQIGNATGWVQVADDASATIPTTGTTAAPAYGAIPMSSVVIPAGATYGFYVGKTSGGSLSYTTASGTGGVTAWGSDANLTITVGHGGNFPSPVNTPRAPLIQVEYGDPAASAYTFAWDNGATTEDISGLASGNYCVTVTDCNGCTTSACDAVIVAATPGCTDPAACNYDPLATSDDGSCLTAYGCIDALACNYDAAATCDDGSCTYAVTGFDCAGNCLSGTFMDIKVQEESVSWGSQYTLVGYGGSWSLTNLTTGGTFNTSTDNVADCLPDGCYEISGISGSGSSYAFVYSLDGGATYTMPGVGGATGTAQFAVGAGVCTVLGCTDPAAANYDPAANSDDGSCLYSIPGCTDASACNYDATATVDDGSCQIGTVTDVSVREVGSWGNYSLVQYGGTWSLTDDQGNVLASDADGDDVTLCLPDGCYDITGNSGSGASYPFGYDINGTGTYTVPGAAGSAGGSAQFTVGAGVCTVLGCTDPAAVNYDPAANSDDGSCAYGTPGCTDASACNYDASATVDDGSCTFAVAGYDCAGNCLNGGTSTDISVREVGSFGNYSLVQYGGTWSLSDDQGNVLASDADGDDVTLCLPDGCYDITGNSGSGPTYPFGFSTDGGLTYTVPGAAGSAGGSAQFAVGAGSCVVDVPGCTDPAANNYDASATIDDGSCTYDVPGCTDPAANNYDPAATIDDGSCSYDVPGCTDPAAINYNSAATVDDGSCSYSTACAGSDITGLSVSGIIHDRVTLNFDNMNTYDGSGNQVCRVDQIRIKYREVGSSSWSQKNMASPTGTDPVSGVCNSTQNTSKLVLNLTASTSYEWEVKVWYCDGQSTGFVAGPNFTTADACPNVANLAVSSPTTTKATFTWDASNGAYSFVRLKARPESANPLPSDWFNIGGAGVAYGTNSKDKNGLTPGQDYRGQARTWCDPNGGPYRATTWSSLLFWTQPTSVRLEGGESISNLDVYPNPSRDVFNVAFTSEDVQDLEVRVVNIVGEVIYTEDLQQFVGEYTKSVDLATYTKGVYFLEITTNNGVVNKKLILQ